jgi:hypothetical protein
MGFKKLIKKVAGWVDNKVIQPVKGAVNDVIGGARDVVRTVAGAALSPFAAVSSAIGIEPVMYNALFKPKASRQDSLLSNAAQQLQQQQSPQARYDEPVETGSRMDYRNPGAQRMQTGQYSGRGSSSPSYVAPTGSGTMLGSDQEEEFLGEQQRRRDRGTLLGA